MLHREQGRAGAGRDADLPVRVLDVAVGGLRRDPERPGDLLGLQAASEHPDHFGLALGQPCRALDSNAVTAVLEAAFESSRPAFAWAASSAAASSWLSGARCGRGSHIAW